MASVQTSDFGEFCDFLTQLRNRGASNLTPEQSVQEFREHQEKLRRWNERNIESAAQAAAGQARSLDLNAMLKRVEGRLSQQGFAD
jgi:hypothetical protein